MNHGLGQSDKVRNTKLTLVLVSSRISICVLRRSEMTSKLFWTVLSDDASTQNIAEKGFPFAIRQYSNATYDFPWPPIPLRTTTRGTFPVGEFKALPIRAKTS